VEYILAIIKKLQQEKEKKLPKERRKKLFHLKTVSKTSQHAKYFGTTSGHNVTKLFTSVIYTFS
jgi:hypothetical protein